MDDEDLALEVDELVRDGGNKNHQEDDPDMMIVETNTFNRVGTVSTTKRVTKSRRGSPMKIERVKKTNVKTLAMGLDPGKVDDAIDYPENDGHLHLTQKGLMKQH